jgi:hypothetical protein
MRMCFINALAARCKRLPVTATHFKRAGHVPARFAILAAMTKP